MKHNRKISVFLLLVVIMIISLGLVLSFNNQSSFVVNTETTLNANMTSLKLGQEVIVTLNLGNYSDVTNGYNAYKAKLIYDKNIFEQVLQDDFISLNDWEELEYNPDTFEFVAIKKVGSKTLENVVQVRLRVKTTASAGTTTIKINNLVTSEGHKDIFVEDKSVDVNVIKDQVVIPDNTNPGNSSNNNSDTIHTNKPSLDSSNKVDDNTTDIDKDDNKTDTDIDEDKDNQEETFKPVDDNKEDKVEEQKVTNIKRNSFLIFIIIILILLIIFTIIYRRKKNDNNKNANKLFMFVLMGVCFLVFAGSVYAYSLFKGELNEDGQINYDDLKLLELYLINKKTIPSYLLENADMNNDDKITITDLTLLVQKLEKTLDYEVEFDKINQENQYIQKNSNFTLSFKATVLYGAKIEKVKINNVYYDVLEDSENDIYRVVLNSSNKAGSISYHFSEVILNNNQKVDVDFTESIEVLKDKPSITNYVVKDSLNDSTLNILFTLDDFDSAVTYGKILITDESGNTLKEQDIKVGSNDIMISVMEDKIYTAKFSVGYNLTNNKDLDDSNLVGKIEEVKELHLKSDYQFEISNFVTEKDTYFVTEKVKLYFDSSNTSKYVPSKIRINGQDYDVNTENGKYVVVLPEFKEFGKKSIKPEMITLSNGKEFKIEDNFDLTVNIFKRVPTVSELMLEEDEENGEVIIDFDVNDEDNALSQMFIEIKDNQGNLLEKIDLNSSDLTGSKHITKVFKNLGSVSGYHVNVIASYSQTGDDSDSKEDIVLCQKDFITSFKANIVSVSSDKKYYEKGENVTLTYQITTNGDYDISKILINEQVYPAVKLEKDLYKVDYKASTNAIVEDIRTSKVISVSGNVSKVSNTVQIEVLKDAPKMSDYKVTSNNKDAKVVLDFDIIDNDNSFVEGNVVLLLKDGTVVMNKPIQKGKNKVEFDVELFTKYDVKIDVTYDRDSILDSTNKFTTVLSQEMFEILAEEFSITNVNTIKNNQSSKYFLKNEKIHLEFDDANSYVSTIVAVIINNKQYDVQKDGNTYSVIVDGYLESGSKTLTISKVKLATSHELEITSNNQVQIEVLKAKPVIENYKTLINKNDSTANISFDILDNDHAFANGNIIVVDKNNKTIIDSVIKSGANNVKISLEEDMDYTVKISANYNLTSDLTITDKDVTGVVSLDEGFKFSIDYDFKATNFKTYNNDLESVKFHKDKDIKVIFDSSNSTSNIPSKIRINDNDYDVKAENGKYVAVLSGFSQIGLNTINIQSITLSNGKKFDVNQSLEVTILKDIPVISNLNVVEDTTNNQVKVDFNIQDEDDTLTLITINLLNDKNEIAEQIILPDEAIHNNSCISKVFNGVLTSKYKVEILGNYTLGSTDSDVSENVVLASKEIEASARAEVILAVSDKVYYEKESNVTLIYTISTNKTDNISSITVNGKDYAVTQLTDGRYQISYKIDNNSGVKSLEATKVTYNNGLTATINNTLKVEVLKDALTVTNYKQIDDVQNSKVTLNFDVVDSDDSFISGEAILTKKSDNTVVTKNITKGSNSLEFDVVELEKYDFVIKATYDRDTNALTESLDNRIESSLLTQEIQLVFDYNITVSDITTSKNNTNTKYFEKDEDIVVSFKSSNKVNYEVTEVTINDKTYTVTKVNDCYQVTLDGFDSVGVHTITIGKIKLSNTKEFDISSNNTVQIEVLKTAPLVREFSYTEDNYGDVSVKFDVIDTDKSIDHGKVIISNDSGNIKEQDLIIGSNVIKFTPKEQENYFVKVVASYDLDSNQLDNDSNYFEDALLLENEISFGKRQFQIKDIVSSTVYVQTADGVKEASSIKIADLNNLDNYIVKVKAKDMPVFYTTIEEYRIDNNVLKFVLKYDDIIQYNGNLKQNKLEIEYGDVKDGVVEGTSLDLLIKKIEANPSGTFELTKDYDASFISDGQLSVISSKFTGTLNGNGYKIRNLNKPLFNELEGATIKNLIFSDVNLSGANSKGTIANVATNSEITNVHIKGLKYVTGADHSAGMIGEATNTNVNQSSVTDFAITTSGKIRISAIIGKLTDGTIINSYVEGSINSTQSKDGNGLGGILGHGFGTVRIENCISKVLITNNMGPRLNGAIVGIFASSSSVLKNNVSLSTGTNFYSIHGNEPGSTATNNYELLDSGLSSNASANRVISISKNSINSDFYKNNANFDETIWDLSGTSFDKLPILKNDDPNSVDTEVVENGSVYIPDYNRIKKVSGYSSSKEILYHNIFKLMPYYDAKYLVEDGSKFLDNHILNTKVIRYVMPYSNGKLLTYLTSENYNTITDIKVVFDDYTISNYKVNFSELNQNISIYNIEELGISYAPNKYVIKNDSPIIETLKDRIAQLDYATVLEPLTTAADARHYKDHYNEVIKSSALTIALQLLQNDEENVLTINNEVLNNKIREQLIDGGRFDKMIYAYNYFDRWYSFEIGGARVSDILLFENKMFKDTNTLDNIVNEVLVGNLGVNVTDSFFKSNIAKYTASSELKYFLDYIITNIGGYSDVNDWFTEYFSARNILAEFGVDKNPNILYRAWYQIKKNSRMILPIITLPSDCTYIISGPAHLQIGPSQLYHKDVNTAAGKAAVQKTVNNHVTLVKRHLSTLAGSFDPNKWNNYCIMVYDCTKIITGYKNSYFPGTNIVIGTSPVYTQGKVGQNYSFFKNFSEVLGLWQPGGSAAGVGNTAGFLWFIARPGLTNFDTWTHEFEHALFDKIMLFQAGTRFKYGLETLTEGNVEQNGVWSENNLVQDVGPYYFNTTYDLNKEGNATQNLSPDRIDTREKLENYFKGQQNALDLLDYIEGKAFIRLTPEQQARVATRMSQSGSWSSWGAITAAQAEQMNLTSLESLYDNRIIIRPENAWGVSVRGLSVINSIGQNDYGFESVWVNRWYIGHNDNGIPDAFSAKRNYFEMLGYAGVDGYVTYGRGSTKTDLDAIQKITKSVTGTAMNWKEYKMSRYAAVEENIRNNKYIDVDYMIERFYQALSSDTNRNATSRTNLRKIYYHYLKSVTNDFVDDPLGTTVEVNHIKTAEELVEKINAQPYGYYVLDNDIDFSHMTKNVTQTFMGRLDGNGHKISGNTLPIFNKIRYGYVGNIKFDGTNIPKTISNAGALSYKSEMSTVEKINVTNLKMNFGGRNDLSLIGGAVSNVVTRDCTVEKLTYHIRSAEDMAKLNEDTGGIFVIDNDIDFAGKNYNGTVISNIFTGKIDGQGHTLSNLTDASLFANFRGTVENLKIKNFSNTSSGRGNGDYVTAFTQESFTATFRNLRFENITLSGRNNVAVVSGADARDNANSVFENISVKNANVTGTGVYVSTFIGRKYGGRISNVFVQGKLTINSTENGGLVGSLQQNGTVVENVVTDVSITKTHNTYGNASLAEINGSMFGNIYNTPVIRNSIAFGNMSGYTNNAGVELKPYKFAGASEAQVIATMTKCFEVDEEIGSTRVSENTNGKLNSVARANLNKQFYKDLGFDEAIWNLDNISSKGYPVLK